MPPDKSQLETITLNERSTEPLTETGLPQQPALIGQVVDGRYFIEKELGQGGVGAVYLARDRDIIKQIGRALSAAHDKGIFHRDLKPENIMLQSLGAGEEQVKIIDFGIAKLKDSMIAPSTMPGATAGTVSYMAPEQLGGRTVSAATDIYALGAIAY